MNPAELNRLADLRFGSGVKKENPWYLPENNKRIIVYGDSGSGKTSAILAPIASGEWKFDKLYVYCKDFDADTKYRYLIATMNELEKELQEKYDTEDSFDLYEMGNSLEDIPEVNDFDSKKQNLVIIDDFVTDKGEGVKKILDIFIRGRKKNITCIYISQSFFDIPKIIRMNSNYFLLFEPSSERDLTTIAYDLSGRDTVKDFKVKFNKVMDSGDFQFVMIDKVTKRPELKFRKGFKGLMLPEKKDE